MENITHSLIGATLAETVLPKGATSAQRTLFFVTGVLAANLPDADLLYTGITPSPLGYLLHHRGHTHTLGGVVVLAALVGLVSMLPRVRAVVRAVEPRYWILVFAALASHLIADSWNSYGVHALWPFSSRWYYGDAVFIAEPWLWALLGVSVAMNTRSRWARLLIAGALIAIPIGAGFVGAVSLYALLPIAGGAATLGFVMRRRPPAVRAATSLVAVALFVAMSFVLRDAARQSALALDRGYGPHRVVDLIASPRPGNPLCWSVLVLDETADVMLFRRAEVGVGTWLVRSPCGGDGRGNFIPGEVQPLTALRTAMRDDCRIRAWLQFGRAPSMSDGWIADARFGGQRRGNFSAMQVAAGGSAGECPAHLTSWDLPRADVLLGPPTSPFEPQ